MVAWESWAGLDTEIRLDFVSRSPQKRSATRSVKRGLTCDIKREGGQGDEAVGALVIFDELKGGSALQSPGEATDARGD